MPEHEARARAVYDHDEDEPRPSGRRRRQVADWGVNEAFDGMPGRRFDRRGEEHRIPRGGADDGRRTIVITQNEPVAAAPIEAVDEEFASREDALRAREEHDAVWAGDEPFAAHEAEVHEYVAEPVEVDEGPAVFEEERERAIDQRRADSVVRGGVEGRRTVKIGGRPGEFQTTPARRRPARTVHERVGPRPDRIAAWACALGLLLIIIAIATASI